MGDLPIARQDNTDTEQMNTGTHASGGIGIHDPSV
jgi:hypothetical protein